MLRIQGRPQAVAASQPVMPRKSGGDSTKMTSGRCGADQPGGARPGEGEIAPEPPDPGAERHVQPDAVDHQPLCALAAVEAAAVALEDAAARIVRQRRHDFDLVARGQQLVDRGLQAHLAGAHLRRVVLGENQDFHLLTAARR